ncbi:hypothetical protein DFP72DRAFT_1064517 [Ephemerocybe angulata]|uniref:Uncharacterized protein n=1 Tax=Ephemerocybe angulata TaxID=980116 RepID=A0A8H6I7P6_9AGAR|nr:hypothetical protein DFP72DRAFT_1064517 [Tulosesus angulatus]
MPISSTVNGTRSANATWSSPTSTDLLDSQPYKKHDTTNAGTQQQQAQHYANAAVPISPRTRTGSPAAGDRALVDPRRPAAAASSPSPIPSSCAAPMKPTTRVQDAVNAPCPNAINSFTTFTSPSSNTTATAHNVPESTNPFAKTLADDAPRHEARSNRNAHRRQRPTATMEQASSIPHGERRFYIIDVALKLEAWTRSSFPMRTLSSVLPFKGQEDFLGSPVRDLVKKELYEALTSDGAMYQSAICLLGGWPIEHTDPVLPYYCAAEFTSKYLIPHVREPLNVLPTAHMERFKGHHAVLAFRLAAGCAGTGARGQEGALREQAL